MASGKHDWDAELILQVKKLDAVDTREKLSQVYLQWISGLGKINVCRKCTEVPKDVLVYNLDEKWMTDKNLFSDSLISTIKYIRDNRFQGTQYYNVLPRGMGDKNLGNERAYKEMVYPDRSYRLLSLFRYWNIINYYFPYKYVMDKNWNNVLQEMIPVFAGAKDTIAYHMAMKQLTASINDSHAQFWTKYVQQYYGEYALPVTIKLIDDKAVVTEFKNFPFAEKDGIKRGDAITHINGKSVAEMVSENRKYVGGSNPSALLNYGSYYVTLCHKPQVMIRFDRDGKSIEKQVTCYTDKELNYVFKPDDNLLRILPNNVGYVNMWALTAKRVDSVMSVLKATKAIIFDIRKGADGSLYELAKNLNPVSEKFASFTVSDPDYPGRFRQNMTYFCGRTNKKYFKGKVVLLADEKTQSHAEFTCMALQTAPNARLIGSQTSGADGNVSIINFPGGFQTYFSAIGVFYPDGRKTQRIGIVPDIEVRPTIEGIRQGKDEVLERALVYINTGR